MKTLAQINAIIARNQTIARNPRNVRHMCEVTNRLGRWYAERQTITGEMVFITGKNTNGEKIRGPRPVDGLSVKEILADAQGMANDPAVASVRVYTGKGETVFYSKK